MAERTDRGVFIIYTGGTIGSLPRDKKDPLSPLEPAPIEEVLAQLPRYDIHDQKLALGQHRIKLGTYSFDPPLDSSNIGPQDWARMAQVVKDNYASYEGFVLLHGTDTLAYTAAALSFMLENLQKPVIITGSQKPIGDTRSDAAQNLITAIEIAAGRSLETTVVPEVCVYFRDLLTRGCRTTKLSASSYNAFDSPNLKPLATAGEHIVFDDTIIRPASTQRLHIRTKIEPNVASLDIFPGMKPELLRKMLTALDLKGVVLQTFGTGNAPSFPDFLQPIGQAVDDGVLIVDVTQCRQGEVELGLYEVSAGLLARGVVSGMDMTPEAALTKLFIILGDETDANVAADLMQLNMRGEQRISIFNLHFPSDSFGQDDDYVKVVEPVRPMVAGRERFKPDAVENALLRVTGLDVPGAKRGIIQFRVFIDAEDANENTPTSGNPHFLGEATKNWNRDDGDEAVVVPITKQVKDFIDNNHTNTLSIVNTSGQPFAWKRLNIACFADC